MTKKNRSTWVSIITIFFMLHFITSALATDCKKAVELYNKGTVSQDLKEKERLLKDALEAFCKDKTILARIHNNLADAYENQDRPREAAAEYEKAIKLDPNLSTPYIESVYKLYRFILQ